MSKEQEKRFETAEKAVEIIKLFTEGILSGSPREVENKMQLFDEMVDECAYILTEKLIEGDITPMEYIKIANVLTEMISEIFFKEEDEE